MPATDRLCVVESSPPSWNFTPTCFNKIHWTNYFFCKTPLQLESYKISNNEMTCLLGIGNVVNIRERVCVCLLHLAVTVTLYQHYVCSQPPIFTYNLLSCLQWIFISGPDFCISWTNCSLGPHIIRGINEGASLKKLNILEITYLVTLFTTFCSLYTKFQYAVF